MHHRPVPRMRRKAGNPAKFRVLHKGALGLWITRVPEGTARYCLQWAMPTILTHSDIRVKAPAVFGLNIEFLVVRASAGRSVPALGRLGGAGKAHARVMLAAAAA